MKKYILATCMVLALLTTQLAMPLVSSAEGDVQQPVYDGDKLVYETELGVPSGNTWFMNTIASFSGTGYLFLGDGGITMKIHVPKAGRYKLEVSSANDNGTNRCDKLSINGGTSWYIATYASAHNTWELNQPGTENWKDGVLQPTPPDGGFDFVQGTNIITFSYLWGYAAYDRIILTPYVQQPAYDGDKLVYETELGVPTGNVWLRDTIASYSGKGYYVLGSGGFTMKIHVPSAGKYKLEVSSANENGSNRCDYMSINGGANCLISTHPSAHNTWELSQPGAENWVDGVLQPIPPEGGFDFVQGTNTITFSANWGYCAYDRIILTPLNTDSVEIKKSQNPGKFVVTIPDIVPTSSYQVWAYQKITSYIFEGGEVTNWVLLLPYTLGSAFDIDANGVGTKEIDAFEGIEGNYTISVRVKDNTDSFVKTMTDTFNDEQIGNVKIVKVEVDGDISHEKTEIKQILQDYAVEMRIFSNITENVTYTAVINDNKYSATLSQNGNKFSWNIGNLEPGKYYVTLSATGTNGTKDSKTIPFVLFKPGKANTYGIINDADITTILDGGIFKITVLPDIERGGYYKYCISEPGRSPFDTSSLMAAGASETYQGINQGEYGIYQIATYVKRSGELSSDDGIIKCVEYKRSETPSQLAINAAGDMLKNKPIQFSALATIAGVDEADIMYSYWRRDANGWTLVRDYDLDNTWQWSPGRIGDYTIQVRAKGPGARSYEVLGNKEIVIGDNTDTKAIASNVQLTDASGTNLTTLNIVERVPIEIRINTDSPEDDLMYKYIISNGFIHYIETTYSIDPNYVWVPGKAGTYRVSVLMKNSKSFGKYDYVRTFDVVVSGE